jgi:hypothetical protein
LTIGDSGERLSVFDHRGDPTLMPAKLRHLPWLVCLAVLFAGCSSAGDSHSTAPDGTGTSVSSEGPDADEEPGETGDSDQ